ncbi:hypothetical protein Nepgr_016313 [Nepenthes gracilis]|uniref:Uncharacterized protein n=1 Tax=Nepenthes gracilis TaxID=150966 RepID=A0AAD3XR73_NEPGR|nr:hypothetical protein Nepgr_016313 [Nepenthes gracilis]
MTKATVNFADVAFAFANFKLSKIYDNTSMSYYVESDLKFSAGSAAMLLICCPRGTLLLVLQDLLNY